MHGPSSSSQPPPSSGRVLISRRASDIQAEAIHWLWPQRIPKGKLCLFAGPPGLGKSQVTTYTAAIVSSGGTWCTGEKCEPGDVLILSAEDDPSDTIRPRLEACGANLDRVQIIDGVHMHNVKLDLLFNLKLHLDLLAEKLRASPDATLVIIDPISAYLSGINSHKNADVRSVMGPLAKLAADHGVAVVCVTHLNKGHPND
jgi:RecA-family ATPase